MDQEPVVEYIRKGFINEKMAAWIEFNIFDVMILKPKQSVRQL